MENIEFDKTDRVDKINREKLLDVCNFIDNVMTYDINLLRPFEVKKLYDAKTILLRHAYKYYPE